MKKIIIPLLAVTIVFAGLALLTVYYPIDSYGVVREIDTADGKRMCKIECPELRHRQFSYEYWTRSDSLQVGDTIKDTKQ